MERSVVASSVYRGGRSFAQTPVRDASPGLNATSASAWLNNTSMMGIGSTSALNHSGLLLHAASPAPQADASALNSTAASLGARHKVSAREFAEMALAPLTAALSPSIPADRFPPTPSVGPASLSRTAPHQASLLWADVPASAPPAPLTDRAPSLFPLDDGVGGKRPRESFAPEPSPYSANRRASGAGLGATPGVGGAGSVGRPAQRRKVGRHPSQTVRRILEIIKDTSTPASEARSAAGRRGRGQAREMAWVGVWLGCEGDGDWEGAGGARVLSVSCVCGR